MRTNAFACCLASLAGVGVANAQNFDRSFSAGSERFGEALSSAGDLNADGFPEILIGDPGFDGSPGADTGAVFVFSGAALMQSLQPLSPAPSPVFILEGQAAGDEFGRSICNSSEDYDSDGDSDLLVGAPKRDGTAGVDCGALYVISGDWLKLKVQNLSAPTSGALHVFEGISQLGQFGFAVDGNGDGDVDGLMDVAVGAPFHNGGAGRVEVISGAWIRATLSGATLPPKFLWTDSPGIGANRKAGWDLAWVGDFDRDGEGDDDLVVGIPNDSAGQNNGGSARVFSGTGFSQIIQLLAGQQIGETGISVAGPGDLNGDTKPEILIGAPQETPNSSPCGSCCNNSGIVFLFRSPSTWPPSNWDSPYSVQTSGNAAACHSAHLGRVVSGCGDFNGDGLNDAIVGQPDGHEGGFLSGVVAILRDHSNPANHLVFKIAGGSGDHLGSNVAGVGDVNNDGFSDVAATASGGGYVHFILGRDDSCNGPVTIDCNGNGRDDSCDIAMRLSEDVNNNGIPDECECYGVSYCTAKTNSLGCVPSIGGTGSMTLSGPDDFSVIATNVLNNKQGIRIWSTAPATVPFQGATLCVQPPLVRSASGNSGGSPAGSDCSGVFDFPVSDAYMALRGWSAGTTIFFQIWSRDPGFPPPINSNLTDGLRVLVCP